VAKDEDLEILVRLMLAGGDEAKDAAQDQVQKGEEHARILRSRRLRRESHFRTPTRLRGNQHTFALLDERVPSDGREFDRDLALIELICRYLASHGPATAQDLGWWSSLTIADIKEALRHLREEVRSGLI
jgi:hypothetical protein